MAALHVTFAWAWVLAGLTAGAIQGTGFHRDDFMGGYGSWPRRLTRLGHVAFFGTGAINLGFGLTWLAIEHRPTGLAALASPLLLAGAVTMPVVCYLAAWRRPLRILFPIPVTCLILGVLLALVAWLTGHTGLTS